MLVEYCIPLPFSVEGFQVGQRYACIEALKAQKSEEPGAVQLLKSCPYQDAKTGRTGHYTKISYRAGSKLPSWVRRFVSADLIRVTEESWNCYPDSQHTQYSLEGLNNKVKITVQSRYTSAADGPGQADNCTTDMIDLAIDDLGSYYSPGMDPKLCDLGDGPYTTGWQERCGALMYCLKRVEVKVSVMGVSGMAEKMLQTYIRAILFRNACQAVCTQDEWQSLSLTDVEALENEECNGQPSKL